jgi:hypothetical protein
MTPNRRETFMPLFRLGAAMLLACALFMLAACGYSMGGSGESVIEPEYRTMAISGVDNPTTLAWLEPRIRELLRDELTRRGTVVWTDERSRADSLIHITIIKYYRPTAVEGSHDQTLRSSAIFQFSAEIKSATDGHIIWNSGEIGQDWPFYQGQEDEADAEVTSLGIRRLADRMEQNY